MSEDWMRKRRRAIQAHLAEQEAKVEAMNATEGDRSVGAELAAKVDGMNDDDVIAYIAAALAAERERARAPFLALANELTEPVARAAIYLGEFQQGQADGEDSERLRIADRIRRAAEDVQ